MKAVVVEVNAIMDANRIEIHTVTLENASAVISASRQKHVANPKVRAAVENQKMWALRITLGGVLTWTSHVATTSEKFCAIAVDCARPFDTNVLSVRCRNHYDVAVARWNIVACFVVLDLCTTKQSALRGNSQRNITLEFDRANDEIASRHQNCSAVLLRACVDRSLYRVGIESGSIAHSAKVSDVINARAEILLIRREVRSPRRSGIKRDAGN